MIERTTLYVKPGNVWLKVPTTIEYVRGRIEFPNADYALKDELKAMAGSKWHGFDDPPRQLWSAADTPRNRFQLAYLKGEPVYAHFEQPVIEHEFTRDLMPHQRELVNHFLTYRYGIMAAEMGCGKTLALQEIMERSGVAPWVWVGPKRSLVNIAREFRRWGLDDSFPVELMGYEEMEKQVRDGMATPAGLIFDEASKLKNHDVKRSQAAQRLADAIRSKHGMNGYVVLASGTPSPKKPTDWWSLCEIAYPGFLKEGSERALRDRLAIMAKKQFAAGAFNQLVTWKDDERKCNVCGDFSDAPQHETDHAFQPSFNEVYYLHKRLRGLVIVKHKKDVLASLPAKRYRTIQCPPSASLLRAAKAIAASADSAITAFTKLRELSDGFQYRDKVEGTTRCTVCPGSLGKVMEYVHPDHPDAVISQPSLFDASFVASLISRETTCPACNGSGEMPRRVRETVEVACPKDGALTELLEENEEVGRIVIFAGFTGSIDRIRELCLAKKWSVVQVDGRGIKVFNVDGTQVVDRPPLEYWADLERHSRVAWVAHPESGGMSFTLVEARTCVFWSNSFKTEYRPQAEDRIHRPGMDENAGCEIVDLIHLPSDAKTLATIREDRRLEQMTLGELKQCFGLAA